MARHDGSVRCILLAEVEQHQMKSINVCS